MMFRIDQITRPLFSGFATSAVCVLLAYFDAEMEHRASVLRGRGRFLQGPRKVAIPRSKERALCVLFACF